MQGRGSSEMIRLAGKRHLRQTMFRGPAERTLVELWLTELTGRTINGYPEMSRGMTATTSLAALAAMVAPAHLTAGALEPVAATEVLEPTAIFEPAAVELLVQRATAAQFAARAA